MSEIINENERGMQEEAEFDIVLEFDGVEVPLNSDVFNYIKMINIPQLRAFTIAALNQYGKMDKLQEANCVAAVLTGMLCKKRLLSENVHQSFVDVLLSSTMLHNLFYTEDDWTSVYKARKCLLPLAQSMGIPESVTDAIFQTIEAQRGDDTAVPASRPQPNSPTELFSWAVWFNETYKPQV